MIDRWCGEPVKAVLINTSVFLSNKKGFPVLSRAHQNTVKKLFKVRGVVYYRPVAVLSLRL